MKALLHSGTVRAAFGVALGSVSIAMLALVPWSAIAQNAPVDWFAGQPDPLRLTLGTGLTYDDNVFRLPRGASVPATIGDSRGSFIWNLSARGYADVTWSRQRFLATLGANVNRYDRIPGLNYNGTEGRLRWLWRIGDRWDGQVYVDRATDLQPFTNVQGFVRNVLTTQNAGLRGEYWVAPDWYVGAQFEQLRVSSEAAASRQSNLVQDAMELSVRYVPRTNSSVRGFIRQSDGDYPERTSPTLILDTSYRQRDLGVEVDWQRRGPLSGSGRVAYTTRSFPVLRDREFSGLTWRLTPVWVTSAKTGIRFNLAREIGVFEDISATFIVYDTARVDPFWQVSSQVRVTASLSHNKRDFRGGSAAVGVGVGRRVDKIDTAGMSAEWRVDRNWSLSSGMQYSTRRSDAQGLDFTDRLVYLNAQWTWDIRARRFEQ